MVAILDSDIILYKTIYTFETIEDVCVGLQTFVSRLMEETGADEYIGYLSGPTNYRKRLFPTYKAYRLDREVPQLLAPARKYMREELGMYLTENMEADDACSLTAKKFREDGTDFVICTIDKDFQQIIGKHYHIDKKTLTTVTAEEAWLSLWVSCASGDTTDGIHGLVGVGWATAYKRLHHVKPEDYPEAVYKMYCEAGREQDFKSVYMQIKLLDENDYEVPEPVKHLQFGRAFN